ncbi:hypothetical protein C6P45_003211 [Maudiozyma exigua]|uniref:Mid2 domain-containing protein n=1 Tax=Maudiozyma exigua TaxID=34358 RepID=A0A9P7B1Y0_MAUEX|nr:hypothetical protein C6P45_003211 [Kazachstania exigua]
MRQIVSNRNIILATLLLHFCNAQSLGNSGMYSNDTSSSITIQYSSDFITSNLISDIETESALGSTYPTSESSIFISPSDIETSTNVISSDGTSQITISVGSSTNRATSSSVEIPSSSAWIPSFNSTTSTKSYDGATNSINIINTAPVNDVTTVTETTTEIPIQTTTESPYSNPNIYEDTTTNLIDTNVQASYVDTAPLQTDTAYDPNIDGNTILNTADFTEINTAAQDTTVGPKQPAETTIPANTQIRTQIPATTDPSDYNPYHPNRPDNIDDSGDNTNTEVQYTIQPTAVTTNTGTPHEDKPDSKIETEVPTNTVNDVEESNAINTNKETKVVNTNQRTWTTQTEASIVPTNTNAAELDTKNPIISQTQDVTTGTKVNQDTHLSEAKTASQATSNTGLTNIVNTPGEEETNLPNEVVSTRSGYNTLTNNKGLTTTNVETQNPTDEIASETKKLSATVISQNIKTIVPTQRVSVNTDDQYYVSNTINKDAPKTKDEQIVVNSKYPHISVTQTNNNEQSTGKPDSHVGSSSANYLISGKKIANTVTTNARSTGVATIKSNTGIIGDQKSKDSTKTKTAVSYTLSADNNWLPSSIIVQTTDTKKSESSINPSSFPTSLPAAIAASTEVTEPSNTTLITIGFGEELNYNFLVENPLSSAQIFNFLPEALIYPFYVDEISNKDDVIDNDLSYESMYVSWTVSDGTTTISPTDTLVKRAGTIIDDAGALSQIFNQTSAIINTLNTVKNRFVEQTTTTTRDEPSAYLTATVSSSSVSASATIDSSLIKVKQISPYVDSNRDYVVSVAEIYFPSDFVDVLRDHLQDKDSVIFDNPVPSLKSLMNLTDPSINLLGFASNLNSISSSSSDTENSQENQQQINQAFISSIKNGTQYGSLDVTGMKKAKLSKAIRNRLIIYLSCMVFGIFIWVLSFLTLFRYIQRRLFPQKSISLNPSRRSFLNITKIGLYGDDIGSLWSGDSSNYSDSINEKIKHLVENRKSKQKRFTLFSSNTNNDLSLCYNNFIQNANGDTLITNENANTNTFNYGNDSPISHSFGDFNHQTISTYNTSDESFDFDVVNAHNNPFSDNYGISPKSKTIDLFSDNIDENFDIKYTDGEEEVSIADFDVGELDELDEELYKNLIGTIKNRDPNDPLAVETKS